MSCNNTLPSACKLHIGTRQCIKKNMLAEPHIKHTIRVVGCLTLADTCTVVNQQCIVWMCGSITIICILLYHDGAAHQRLSSVYNKPYKHC